MLRDTDPAHILLSLAISLESRGHMRPRSPGVGTSWGSAWLCVLQLSSWGGRTAPGAWSHCSWGSWRGCLICFSAHDFGRLSVPGCADGALRKQCSIHMQSRDITSHYGSGEAHGWQGAGLVMLHRMPQSTETFTAALWGSLIRMGLPMAAALPSSLHSPVCASRSWPSATGTVWLPGASRALLGCFLSIPLTLQPFSFPSYPHSHRSSFLPR